MGKGSSRLQHGFACMTSTMEIGIVAAIILVVSCIISLDYGHLRARAQEWSASARFTASYAPCSDESLRTHPLTYMRYCMTSPAGLPAGTIIPVRLDATDQHGTSRPAVGRVTQDVYASNEVAR